MTNDVAKKTKQQDVLNWDMLQNLAITVLKKAKAKGASDAEVGINSSNGLVATVRLGNVESLEYHRDKGIGITIYKGKKKGNVAISDITEVAIDDAINAAIKIADYTEEDECNGLADSNLMAKNVPDLDLYHFEDISSKQAIALATECETFALNFDKKITNSDGASFNRTSKYIVYANSNGFIGAYPATNYSMSCVVVANDKDSMQRDYEYSVARKFSKLMNIEKLGKNAASKTIARLGAKKINTCKAPVIFSARLASGLIGNFLSGISGSSLYRKTSFLLDSLDRRIFPEFVSMQEDPFIKGGLGSCAFDGDGVATNKKYIVERGVVKSYILGNYSAKKLKMQTTGNAGGVHNLHLGSGNCNFDQLVAKMDKGLVVTELMGQGVNLVTGDYSRGAVGFWVENGKVQYPVHEITIAGNLKDMFANIVEIGNDIETRTNIQTGSILLDEMKIAGN